MQEPSPQCTAAPAHAATLHCESRIGEGRDQVCHGALPATKILYLQSRPFKEGYGADVAAHLLGSKSTAVLEVHEEVSAVDVVEHKVQLCVGLQMKDAAPRSYVRSVYGCMHACM